LVVLGSLNGRISFENGYIDKPILGEVRLSSSLIERFSDRVLESPVACSSFQSSTATSMKFLVSFAYAPPSFLCFNRPTPGGSDAPPIAET
jgi:hypothetical protein